MSDQVTLSIDGREVSVPKGTTIRAVFPLSQAQPCYITGYSNQLST